MHIVDRPMALNDFLADRLQLSKTKIKVLLDRRKVFVNQQRVWIASYKLKRGDKVEAIIGQAPKIDAPLEICFQDDWLVVVNKPVGMVTNADPQSVEARLRKQLSLPALQAVHRLDRETSGLVLFAKTQIVFDACKKMFQEKGIMKTYRALLYGQLRSDQTVRTPLHGQPAVTHVKVIQHSPVVTYVQAIIETGRKHQIRLHCAGIGFPVVGENEYVRTPIPHPVLRNAPHHLLHAYKVEFAHPITKQSMSIVKNEPQTFLKILNQFF